MAPPFGAPLNGSSPMKGSKSVMLSPSAFSKMKGSGSSPSLGPADTECNKRRSEIAQKEISHRANMRKTLSMTALPTIADGKTGVAWGRPGSRSGPKTPKSGGKQAHETEGGIDISPSLARFRNNGAFSKPAMSYDVEEEPISEKMKEWMSGTLASIPSFKNRASGSRPATASKAGAADSAAALLEGSRPGSRKASRDQQPSAAQVPAESSATPATASTAPAEPASTAPASFMGLPMPTAAEVKSRLGGEDGFPEHEVDRMQKAFLRYQVPNTHEIHQDDLDELMQYLGYLRASEEEVMKIKEEVTPYSTLEWSEFVSFAERFCKWEAHSFRVIFDKFDEDGGGSLSTAELSRFMSSLGFTPLRKMVREALSIVDEDGTGTVSFEELVLLIAIYRRSEGFTNDEIMDLRDSFAKELEGIGEGTVVREPVKRFIGNISEHHGEAGGPISATDALGVFIPAVEFDPSAAIPTAQLTSVLLKFFGPASAEACQKVGEEACAGRKSRNPDAAEDEKQPPSDLAFAEAILWARKVREIEFDKFREEFKKQDADGSGKLETAELMNVIRDCGYTLLPDVIKEVMDEADEDIAAGEGKSDAAQAKDGSLDFDEFVNLMLLFRDRDGFSKAETAELTAVFKRFDDDNSGEVEVLELSDIMRYIGHATKLDDVQRLLAEVDFNHSGSLDFKEFLRLMRMHREEQMADVRKLFNMRGDQATGKMATSKVGQILEHLGLPGSKEDVKDQAKMLDFEDLVIIVDMCREKKVAKQKRCAGFSDDDLAKFQTLFNTYDGDKSGEIDAKEISGLVGSLGFAMGTKEERETVLTEIDNARDLAAEMGVENVGKKGGSPVNFWVMIQMLRVMYRKDDNEKLKRETTAVEETKFSTAEIDSFREIFVSWYEKDKAFELEKIRNAGGKETGEEVETKELTKDCMRRLLQSLGVTVTPEQRKKLERKIDDQTQTGKLDFADFLRIMRWMLDTDFAGLARKLG